MHSGKLWSPEGYGFTPADSSHWALLCRKAHTWGDLYDRVSELEDWLRSFERKRQADTRTGSLPGNALADPGSDSGRGTAGGDPPSGGVPGRTARSAGRNLFLTHLTTNGSEEGVQP